MIIGNKNEFAVELYINKEFPKMGYAKLWFQNMFIGTLEDLIFLEGYLIALIDEFRNSKLVELNIQEKSKTEIFNKLKSTKKHRSEYAVLGSTFTDDFEIYSFLKKDEIFVVWKIRDSETIFEDLKIYDKQIHIGKVEKSILEEIKQNILTEINLAFL